VANRMTVDLDSPDGNAYALMGIASRLAKDIGWGRRLADEIVSEMQEGDYNNLLEVFEQYFSNYADLVSSKIDRPVGVKQSAYTDRFRDWKLESDNDE
jgi:hypothetical protein